MHQHQKHVQKALIDFKASNSVSTDTLSFTDVDGFQLLHAPAVLANIALVEYLVANGADLAAKTDDGCTPLMTALLWENHILPIVSGEGLQADLDKDGITVEAMAEAAQYLQQFEGES